MVKQKSLKKNALLNTMRTVMQIVFPLITFPYASRILMPDGIGKVNFVAGIVSYFAIIAALGINNYGIREAAKCRDKKDELTKLTKELFYLNIISTIIAYILFAFALFLVPKFGQYKLLMCVYSATILFSTLGIEWLYIALEEYSYITIRQVAFQIISLILLFLLVRTKDDYIAYATISVFANVGSNIYNIIHSRKYIEWKKKTEINILKHIRPVLILFSMSLAISLYVILDTTMLGFLSSNMEVGLYSAAIKITKMIIVMISSVSSVLLPRLSYYIQNNQNEEFDSIVNKSLNYVLFFSIPATVGLSCLSRPVVMLFAGEAFIGGIPVMQIVTPIIVFISLSGFIGIQVFMPLKKEMITLFSVIAGALIDIISNILLIPRYGAFGAGISTLLAEAFVTLIQLFYSKKIISYRELRYPLFQYILASLIMGAIVSLVSSYLKSLILSLLIPILIGVFIYLGLLVIWKNRIVCESLSWLKRYIK